MFKRLVISVVLVVGSLFLIWSLARQTWGLWQAGKNVDLAQNELKELLLENQALKEQLVRVQSPDFIEKEAKDKLDYVTAGEVVVVLPQKQPVLKLDNPTISTQETTPEPNWRRWYQALFGKN